MACGPSFQSAPPAGRVKLAETTALTCAFNEDCWCRNFTGA